MDRLIKDTASTVKKVKVLFYPNQVNDAIPNNVVYGDLLMKGFGGNALSRAHYHSLSRYLVRMGICSVDRDMFALSLLVLPVEILILTNRPRSS